MHQGEYKTISVLKIPDIAVLKKCLWIVLFAIANCSFLWGTLFFQSVIAYTGRCKYYQKNYRGLEKYLQVIYIINVIW